MHFTGEELQSGTGEQHGDPRRLEYTEYCLDHVVADRANAYGPDLDRTKHEQFIQCCYAANGAGTCQREQRPALISRPLLCHRRYYSDSKSRGTSIFVEARWHEARAGLSQQHMAQLEFDLTLYINCQLALSYHVTCKASRM